MVEYIAGFELPEGVSVTDLDKWPYFAEWYDEQNGIKPDPQDGDVRTLFEAFLAGAYWQWDQGRG